MAIKVTINVSMINSDQNFDGQNGLYTHSIHQSVPQRKLKVLLTQAVVLMICVNEA